MKLYKIMYNNYKCKIKYYIELLEEVMITQQLY